MNITFIFTNGFYYITSLEIFIFAIVRTVVESLYLHKKETVYASSKITASDFVGFLELSRTLPFKMSSKLDPGLYDPELDPGR